MDNEAGCWTDPLSGGVSGGMVQPGSGHDRAEDASSRASRCLTGTMRMVPSGLGRTRIERFSDFPADEFLNLGQFGVRFKVTPVGYISRPSHHSVRSIQENGMSTQPYDSKAGVGLHVAWSQREVAWRKREWRPECHRGPINSLDMPGTHCIKLLSVINTERLRRSNVIDCVCE